MRLLSFASGILLGIMFALSGVSVAQPAAGGGPGSNRVWVVYKDGAKGPVQAALRAANAQVHFQFDDLNAFAVTMPAAAINGLQNNPNIEYIEEDPVRVPFSALPGETPPYGIGMVQATTMQSRGYYGLGVHVCVIDSGLLVHSNVPPPGHSITYVSGNLAPNYDGIGHGTHVANTIAAASSNGNVGVAPGADLIIVRVFGDDGTWAYSSTLVNAAYKCRDNSARIISMSLGGTFKSVTEQRAFDSLYKGNILSIAAAGNDGNSRTSYPAGYASVVSVAAIDKNMQHAGFSQYNKDVELAAPGVAVWSTVPWMAIASVTVNGSTFSANSFEGAATTNGTSGPLAEGNLCDSVGSYTGKVVHCKRGTITFAEKVQNAVAGGAVAVMVSNNVSGNFSGTLGDYASPIPAVSVSQEDGVILSSNSGQTATVVSSLDETRTGYEAWDGTSMATPHVSGVAALVWAACPAQANATSVRNAMNASALDLGASGRDSLFGYGLVQACAAARLLCGACP
jgi:subtilisin family serine protease